VKNRSSILAQVKVSLCWQLPTVGSWLGIGPSVRLDVMYRENQLFSKYGKNSPAEFDPNSDREFLPNA